MPLIHAHEMQHLIDSQMGRIRKDPENFNWELNWRWRKVPGFSLWDILVSEARAFSVSFEVLSRVYTREDLAYLMEKSDANNELERLVGNFLKSKSKSEYVYAAMASYEHLLTPLREKLGKSNYTLIHDAIAASGSIDGH